MITFFLSTMNFARLFENYYLTILIYERNNEYHFSNGLLVFYTTTSVLKINN